MMKSTRPVRKAAAFGLFLFLGALAFPADLLVPSMELISHGQTSGGVFALQTYGDMALQIQGGYKFGGNISFGLTSTNLENTPVSMASLDLSFLSASISIRDVFSLPMTISYFVGQNDTFGSGEGFDQFGAAPIMTSYRGFLYFPTGPLYDGIYQVQGTGAHIQYIPQPETVSLDLYAYEDTHATYPGGVSTQSNTLGNYSGDFRLLLNFPSIKIEAFAGATYIAAPGEPEYRGGLLFYAANRNVEFLTQVGIPYWNPLVDPTPNVNLFYLLVEPRLHLGIVSIIPTLFWHPGYYDQQSNPTELGAFDVNLNVSLGDLTKATLVGGLESNFRFQSSTGVFQLKESPWIGFSTTGVFWTIKVNTKLWPFSLTDLVDAFVGVRAEF